LNDCDDDDDDEEIAEEAADGAVVEGSRRGAENVRFAVPVR
jgi:hypothetical protein